MNDPIKDGGPAFPVWKLRDYFAAKALPAVYRSFWDDVRAGRLGSVPEEWEMGVALDAYALADAMLKARENK